MLLGSPITSEGNEMFSVVVGSVGGWGCCGCCYESYEWLQKVIIEGSEDGVNFVGFFVGILSFCFFFFFFE